MDQLRLDGGAVPYDGRLHGTRRCYQLGCRCAHCTHANTTYQRGYRAGQTTHRPGAGGIGAGTLLLGREDRIRLGL